MFKIILYSDIYHLANFDVLIQIDFQVIKKSPIINLGKAYYDIIIMLSYYSISHHSF